jgi:hypothetical protein
METDQLLREKYPQVSYSEGKSGQKVKGVEYFDLGRREEDKDLESFNDELGSGSDGKERRLIELMTGNLGGVRGVLKSQQKSGDEGVERSGLKKGGFEAVLKRLRGIESGEKVVEELVNIEGIGTDEFKENNLALGSFGSLGDSSREEQEYRFRMNLDSSKRKNRKLILKQQTK